MRSRLRKRFKKRRTLERRRSWSCLHSHSRSSAFELFQLSVLFRFGGGGTNTEFDGDPQLRGVRGDPCVLAERRDGVRRATGACERNTPSGVPGARRVCMAQTKQTINPRKIKINLIRTTKSHAISNQSIACTPSYAANRWHAAAQSISPSTSSVTVPITSSIDPIL